MQRFGRTMIETENMYYEDFILTERIDIFT